MWNQVTFNKRNILIACECVSREIKNLKTENAKLVEQVALLNERVALLEAV